MDHESSINPELIIVVQEIIKQTWTREVSIQIEEFDFMSSLEINKKKSWLMLMLEAAQEFIDFKEAQLEDQQKVEEKKIENISTTNNANLQ